MSTTYYVMRNGQLYHSTDTLEEALDFARNVRPRTVPASGLRWEIRDSTGRAVASVDHYPSTLAEAA